jgi:SRSO17 transposase
MPVGMIVELALGCNESLGMHGWLRRKCKTFKAVVCLTISPCLASILRRNPTRSPFYLPV